MKWTQNEVEGLLPIFRRIQSDIGWLSHKTLLVLCSAGGEVACWLAKGLKHGKVIGLELNPYLLEKARQLAKEQGLNDVVEFHPAEKKRIPFPEGFFDALVSEFIVFPTSEPTEIGQPEMARVLKSGGRMILTDVIVIKPVPQNVRKELEAIGLDYLCEGSQDDFRRWMEEAELKDVAVIDLTPTVRQVWQERRKSLAKANEPKGYSFLLDDPNFKLGEAIFYIYVRGVKP